MSDQHIRLGLIGAGRIATAYEQALRNSEVVKLVAAADNNPEAAEAMAEGVGAPAFTSHIDMAEKTELDAVLICTPPDSHADIAVHFLEKNVHVLCEKPLSLDVQSAHRMFEAARLSGAQLIMALKFRHVEDVIRAKAILTSGLLGEILMFENCFSGRVEMGDRWNSDKAVSGGGVIIDNGTHSADLMRYFMGPLERVVVDEAKRIQGLDVEETVSWWWRRPAACWPAPT